MMIDAVELTYPIGVAAKKIVGSEGSGRARVSAKEVEARESDAVSVVVSRSTERCSSFVNAKDVTTVVKASESASRLVIPDKELCNHSCQLSSFQEISKQPLSRSRILMPKCEGVPLPRKVGGVSKSISSCSKRQKVLRFEDSVSLSVVDNTKDISDKFGHCPSKCPSPEKSHLMKQTNISTKRSDKRSRGFLKRNYDYFPVKAGYANFSSVAGGNNFISGLHGLKSDIDDITKLADNLSLEELLGGNCKYPNLERSNMKAADMSENILHSIRKACSVIQLQRTAQPENYVENDSCSDRKFDILGSVTNNVNGDTGDSSMINQSKSNKCYGQNLRSNGNLFDLPSYQPKAILERLALAPPKNLDALILDATKPAISSRSTPEKRSGKQLSLGASLPPFSWSHASSGQNRTNSDGVKSSTSRTSCQGRWAKVGNTAANGGVLTNSFTELESLTYDENLVPLGKSVPSNVNELWPSTYNQALCGAGSSFSSAACSYSSHVTLESQEKMNCRGNAGHSPSLLVAARTLCDIATLSLGQKDGVRRWPKKASQKAMRARKSTSNMNGEETSVALTSVSAPANISKSVDQIIPSKKRKLSIVENRKDHINSISRRPTSWSSHKSSRSLPSKLINDLPSEATHSIADITKQSSTMPPPARVLDNTFNKQQKPRKLVSIDWSKGRQMLGS